MPLIRGPSGWSGILDARVMDNGQSNCYGVGHVSGLNVLGDGLVAMAAAEFDRVYINTNGAYEKLKIGVNNRGYNADGISFGCEFGLAVRWMRETSRGNLFIDKDFIDGSPIAPFQEGAGGGWFNSRVADRVFLDAWLANAGIEVTNVGWIWVQGEGNSAATEAYYLAQLQALRDSMAHSNPVLMPASAKSIITQVNVENNLYGAGVAAAKVAFVAANASARLVPYTNNTNSDNVHLNTKGQVQLGYDAFEKLFNRAHKIA